MTMPNSNHTPTRIISIGVRIIILSVLSLVVCAALWYAVRIFFYDQFITPTDSMIPTLLPGDRIIVDKTISGTRIYSELSFDHKGGNLKSWRMRGRREVRPNDIVVFNFPHHDGKINFVINNVYAKRCVGVPGDSVSIIEGYYSNNNYQDIIGVENMQESFERMPDSIFPGFALHSMPHDSHIPWTIKNFGPLYLPRKEDYIKLSAKEGCLYRMILEWETGKAISYDWDKDSVYADGRPLDSHVFEHGFYFMAGDNVSNSNDSRYWGLVPEEYIVGVVSRISYSIDPKTGKYRKDRFLKKPA